LISSGKDPGLPKFSGWPEQSQLPLGNVLRKPPRSRLSDRPLFSRSGAQAIA
jgi:hypothetical protein